MKKKTPSNKTARIVFLVQPETHDKLHALSAKTGAPLAEHLRRAVEAYLKKLEG